MEKILEIITLLGSYGGYAALGTMVWYAITLRSKTRIEKANASKHETDVIRAQKEIRQKDIDWALQKVKELDQYYKEANKKLDKLSRFNVKLIAIIRRIEIYFCNKKACETRDPPLGTYETEIHIEDNNTEK